MYRAGVGRGRIMLLSYRSLDVQLIALRGLYNAKLCGHSNSKIMELVNEHAIKSTPPILLTRQPHWALTLPIPSDRSQILRPIPRDRALDLGRAIQ